MKADIPRPRFVSLLEAFNLEPGLIVRIMAWLEAENGTIEEYPGIESLMLPSNKVLYQHNVLIVISSKYSIRRTR